MKRKNILLVAILVVSGLSYVMGGIVNFKNQAYEEKLVVTSLLIREKDLGAALNAVRNNKEYDQESYHELAKNYPGGGLYIVIRIDNIGDRGAWGEFEVTVNKYLKGVPKVKLPQIPSPIPTYVVLPLGKPAFPSESHEIPEVIIRWKELNAK